MTEPMKRLVTVFPVRDEHSWLAERSNHEIREPHPQWSTRSPSAGPLDRGRPRAGQRDARLSPGSAHQRERGRHGEGWSAGLGDHPEDSFGVAEVRYQHGWAD